MNDGLLGADGDAIAGLRELLERLREARRERLERFDLGGVYDEIARELADIVDEERHGVDLAEIDERRDAERRADAAAAEAAPRRAEERRLDLDLLPDDLAGRVEALQRHQFVSGEAERRFEALVERLRSRLANAGIRADEWLDAVAEPAIAGSSPRTCSPTSTRCWTVSVAARTHGSTSSWPAMVTSSPSNRGNLDELLESLSRRAAAMQALLGFDDARATR